MSRFQTFPINPWALLCSKLCSKCWFWNIRMLQELMNCWALLSISFQLVRVGTVWFNLEWYGLDWSVSTAAPWRHIGVTTNAIELTTIMDDIQQEGVTVAFEPINGLYWVYACVAPPPLGSVPFSYGSPTEQICEILWVTCLDSFYNGNTQNTEPNRPEPFSRTMLTDVQY